MQDMLDMSFQNPVVNYHRVTQTKSSEIKGRLLAQATKIVSPRPHSQLAPIYSQILDFQLVSNFFFKEICEVFEHLRLRFLI